MLNSIAKKWVEALRSGRFKQGKHRLRTPDGYCCLGVLCELAVEEGIISPSVIENDYHIYGKQRNYLPTKVADWAGMRDISGTFYSTSLAYLNDDGTDFNQIANVIESEPPGLFVKDFNER